MSDAAVQGYFDNTINRDLFALVCGEVLGSGVARTVYECSIDPSLVVKVETGGRSFQNIHEWSSWCDLQQEKALARWLAPCKSISPCGTILLQRRTTPPQPRDFPKTLPRFLADTKRGNFGMLDGRLVCHDYGYVNSQHSAKPVKADWW